MPSTNKRVNLTLTDEIYQRLQVYKTKNGILNDATACLQLVVRQLNSIDQTETIFDTLRKMTPEDFALVSNEGLTAMKQMADMTK